MSFAALKEILSMPRARVRMEEMLIGAAIGVLMALVLYIAVAAWFGQPPKLALIVASLACVLFGALAMWDQPKRSHVSGMQYFPFNRQARRVLGSMMRPIMSVSQRKGVVRGYEIGGVELARKIEAAGILVIGQPGSGKTVVLWSILKAAVTRFDRVVVLDVKGDLYGRLMSLGADAVKVGPWDSAAWLWDIPADIRGDALVREFSRIVVGGERNGSNEFFYRAAAIILSAVISSLGETWTPRSLYESPCASPQDVIKRAAAHDSLLELGFQADKMTNALMDVLTTLITRIRWIGQLAAVGTLGRRSLSLRAWLLDRAGPQILVLNADSRYQGAAEAVFGAMLATIANVVASPAMHERDADEPGILILLDEFPQLGAEAIRAIKQVAEIGRSRGVRVVIAAQDPSQLQAIIGKDEAAAVTAMAGTRVYCRLSPQAAAYVAREVGDREVMRLKTAIDGDCQVGKEFFPERLPVLLPGDLTGLRQVSNGSEAIMQTGKTLGRVVAPFDPDLPESNGLPPRMDTSLWDTGPIQVLKPSDVAGNGAGPKISDDNESMEMLP